MIIEMKNTLEELTAVRWDKRICKWSGRKDNGNYQIRIAERKTTK